MTPFPPWRPLCPELRGLLDALPAVGTGQSAVPLDRRAERRRRPRDEHGPGWRFLPLYLIGRVGRQGLRDLPATSRVLAARPGLLAATFSRRGPGAEIGPRGGPAEQSSRVPRARVGLEVPGDGTLRIGPEERPLRKVLSLYRGTRTRTARILELAQPPRFPRALPRPPGEGRGAGETRGRRWVGGRADATTERTLGRVLELHGEERDA